MYQFYYLFVSQKKKSSIISSFDYWAIKMQH